MLKPEFVEGSPFLDGVYFNEKLIPGPRSFKPKQILTGLAIGAVLVAGGGCSPDQIYPDNTRSGASQLDMCKVLPKDTENGGLVVYADGPVKDCKLLPLENIETDLFIGYKRILSEGNYEVYLHFDYYFTGDIARRFNEMEGIWPGKTKVELLIKVPGTDNWFTSISDELTIPSDGSRITLTNNCDNRDSEGGLCALIPDNRRITFFLEVNPQDPNDLKGRGFVYDTWDT